MIKPLIWIGSVVVLPLGAFLFAHFHTLSPEEKWAHMETEQAVEYHKLATKVRDASLESAQAQVSLEGWIKKKMADCKERKLVIGLDIAGDPRCMVDQHANGNQQAAPLNGNVTTGK